MDAHHYHHLINFLVDNLETQSRGNVMLLAVRQLFLLIVPRFFQIGVVDILQKIYSKFIN